MGADRKVAVTVRLPSSVDSFFERMRHRTVEVQGVKVQMDSTKSELIARAIRYSVQHAEEWIKD